ncbi:purine-cytosine permease family protein [Nocardia otitidiscaviarum]|uniref:Allantoin permease n=1 Tax=Nocardia otitidiscaviarum TaxID=1823 RepID=A0A516NVD9_9NOCA|nr:cytosine permease [Nocardia otitidiscaviarum]MCP9622320.1 cytosine permease [Nocardia otitidiscaviarum]QDP82858.1 allantoin permease [Nocardia otitidiscaviarum]
MTIAGISPDAREAPLLLDTEPPRTLGFTDQAAFWGNIGVSLIGFSGAAYVLYPTGHPPLPLLGALLATLLGTLVGTAMVAGTGAVGTRTGAPAMVVLRGLFGTRLSFVPTVANVVQCVGWGVYELTVIALGVAAMTQDRVPHALVIVAAGVLSTVMAIWPLRVVHLLRKYVTVAVGIAMVYFTVALLRSEVPAPTETSWSGFFPAVDTTLAVSVSFVPLAADYARHSRTVRDSAGATILGYSAAQIWCYVLGTIAILQAGGDATKVFDTFLGVTAGWAFFAVLVLREADQSFANVYSTAMSLQNLLPRVDRRVLAAAVGAVVTLLALPVRDFSSYANFLYLIGSVFVPLSAVLMVDFFLGRGRRSWNLAQNAPARPLMLLPWAIGFVTYQLFNPGSIGWWADFWRTVQDTTGIHPGWWSSASLFSFLAAAVVTAAVVLVQRRRA